MNFAETMDLVRAEEAGTLNLLGNGERVRAHRQDPRYLTRLAEVTDLLAEAPRNRRARFYLEEAMTSSDFPLMFGDILDRRLLAAYEAAPVSWPDYCARSTVVDFRDVYRYKVEGAGGVLPKVPEKAAYTETSLAEVRYNYAVARYGVKLGVSWQTILNDNLQSFNRVPADMANGARHTEEDYATRLFVDANGPHASVFTAGNVNKVTGNPVLSLAALHTAMTVLSAMRDANGKPIIIRGVVLVVPPALEPTANNIVNATQVLLAGNGGTTTEQLWGSNWANKRFRVSVNYYIPVIATTNGDTSWFLFADPNNGMPAIEMGFLAGHETPEVTMKVANATYVGGGAVPALEGDFEDDNVWYRVRHVLGGSAINPKQAVGSNGTGIA